MYPVYPFKGDVGLEGPIGGDLMDASFTIPASLIAPPLGSKYWIAFSAGQNAGLVDGVNLVGQTSTFTFHVLKVITLYGTIGTSDAAGILLIDSETGVATAGENLRVSTTTYCIARTTSLDATWFAGKKAKQLALTVETNALRYCAGGRTPTNAAATPASQGHLLNPGDVGLWDGWKSMSNLKLINAASASNAAGWLSVYF